MRIRYSLLGNFGSEEFYYDVEKLSNDIESFLKETGYLKDRDYVCYSTVQRNYHYDLFERYLVYLAVAGNNELETLLTLKYADMIL